LVQVAAPEPAETEAGLEELLGDAASGWADSADDAPAPRVAWSDESDFLRENRLSKDISIFPEYEDIPGSRAWAGYRLDANDRELRIISGYQNDLE
jgi:hypothetical protein